LNLACEPLHRWQMRTAFKTAKKNSVDDDKSYALLVYNETEVVSLQINMLYCKNNSYE